MKKISEEEFQIIFFKNLFKRIVKSYVFEEKNFKTLIKDKKALSTSKLNKFNDLNDENATKLAKKFVKELNKQGKSFEAILKDEKKIIDWVFKNLYSEL